MIVFLLAAMTLIGLALGGALPAAGGAIRDGRSAAWALEADGAARLGIEAAIGSGWTAGAALAPPGGRIPLGVVAVGPRSTVAASARRLGGQAWVLEARGEVRDAGGGLLSASEVGLLGRLVQTPADTIPRFVAASRGWFRRPP
ncbi:MAG: hypothetical protein AB7R55_17555 [Gemmatimonadales bacterium]